MLLSRRDGGRPEDKIGGIVVRQNKKKSNRRVLRDGLRRTRFVTHRLILDVPSYHFL